MAQDISGAGRRSPIVWYRDSRKYLGRGLSRDRHPLLLLWVCAVALGAGAWFLLRGVAAVAAAGPHLPLPYGTGALSFLDVYSTLLGIALLCATAGLSTLRAWGWMALALCMLLVVALALLASLTMGIVDWAALFAALALALTAAHPTVRELFLQEGPARAAAAREA